MGATEPREKIEEKENKVGSFIQLSHEPGPQHVPRCLSLERSHLSDRVSSAALVPGSLFTQQACMHRHPQNEMISGSCSASAEKCPHF